jgi:hypothetical protein
MSTQVNVNAIEPEGGTTTLTVGQTGQNTVISADAAKVNTFKDSGGNTLFTSNGSGVLSSVNSGFGSSQVLISSQTADDDASLSFTSGIDSTYDEYIFEFINMNPATNSTNFTFQCSTDGGSNYNTTVTSTAFWAYHNEDGADGTLIYNTSIDQAQATAYQPLAAGVGSGADEATAGELHLFNPSSTTYVKNWYSTQNTTSGDTPTYDYFVKTAGYFNTTSAINAIRFQFASGNINEGIIKLWGVK